MQMGDSRIELQSKGRRFAFFDAPDLSSTAHPWAGYHFEESTGPAAPVSRACFAKTTIFLCTDGQGVAHRRHRGIWDRNAIEPGSVFIVRANTEIQAAWTTNPWPTMLLQLDFTKFNHIAPEQGKAIEQALVSALTTTDYRLAGLMLAMRDEVKEGCPSGRLYAESISLALLAYVAGKYAPPPGSSECVASLAPAQKRRIVAYIRADLSANISVSELAGLVHMSPSHFARVFKASFGTTPYRFVMHERIEAAKQMLAEAKMTSSEVAMCFGFSSQSHFLKVFRQFTGVTPRQYQAGL